jgi:hypothetical protein
MNTKSTVRDSTSAESLVIDTDENATYPPAIAQPTINLRRTAHKKEKS